MRSSGLPLALVAIAVFAGCGDAGRAPTDAGGPDAATGPAEDGSADAAVITDRSGPADAAPADADAAAAAADGAAADGAAGDGVAADGDPAPDAAADSSRPGDRPDGLGCPMVGADGPLPDGAEQPPPGFVPPPPRPPEAVCVADGARRKLTIPAGHVVDLRPCVPAGLHNSYVNENPDVAVLAPSAPIPYLTTLRPGTTVLRVLSPSPQIVAVDVTVTESDVMAFEVRPTATDLRLYQPQRWAARLLYRDGTMTEVSGLAKWTAETEGTLVFDGFPHPDVVPRFVPFATGVLRVITTFAGMRAVTTINVSCDAFPTRATLAAHRGVVGETAGHSVLPLTLEFAGGDKFVHTGPLSIVSSNAAVFVVDRNFGECMSRGVAVVSLPLPDRTVATTATCFDASDALGLSVSPMDPVNIDVGEEVFFWAEGDFPGGDPLSVPATWTSSAPAVASFGTGDQAGFLTAHQRGSTEVTASYGALKATRLVVIR